MNDIHPLVEGLKLIDGGSCECYVDRRGPGYFCFDNGKTAPAEFGADRACDSCIAHRALEQWQAHWPEGVPHPHSVPRIITYGDVMVETVNGWVIIEHEDPVPEDACPEGDVEPVLTYESPAQKPYDAILDHYRKWVPDAPVIQHRPGRALDPSPEPAEEPWVPKIGDRVRHTEDHERGPGIVRGRSSTHAVVAWDNGMWSTTMSALLTPVFGPPDMGTRALPQPPAPGVLDRVGITFRRDGFDLHCPDCGKWLNAWTSLRTGPITLAEIFDLLSWLPGAGYEIHDCEGR